MKIAIIGGGAAGFFTAINLMTFKPNANITIYESSNNVLSKVSMSGGGRCNLSNTFQDIKHLGSAYPRGEKLLKLAFKIFDHNKTFDWFENNGIKLEIQDDGCIFPRSQDSQEIIDTFLDLAKEHRITIKTAYKVSSIEKEEKGFQLFFNDEQENPLLYDAVVVTTGGSPRRDGLSMLAPLNLEIVEPVPSLFSFNIPNDPITELMGTVVENTIVKFQGMKPKATGALLITHWGVSGPAILKLSSYAARLLNQNDYQAKLSINWIDKSIEKGILAELGTIIEKNSQKLVTSIRPYDLPSRLWLAILNKAEISDQRRWAELGTKGLNRIANVLTNDEYQIDGRGQFKDEFVTCGGVSLSNIDPFTLESIEHPNLYFAGEVLDIDAITGGFNLQAAWSTGYAVALSLSGAMETK